MKKIRLKKKFYFRNMILLFVCIISFIISYNIKLYSSNEEFIMNLLNDSNYYKKYEDKNIIKKINNYLYLVKDEGVKKELEKAKKELLNSYNSFLDYLE